MFNLYIITIHAYRTMQYNPKLYTNIKYYKSQLSIIQLKTEMTSKQKNPKNKYEPMVKSIHGMNPIHLLSSILLNKIHNSLYWKDKCFKLTAETLIDRAIELTHVGGVIGDHSQPTDFICLVLKLLQIQPEEEIIDEFLSGDYRYLTALAAFYWRLVGSPKQCYEKLEKLYSDYRKIIVRSRNGDYKVICMDEFADDLLMKDIMFEVTLPNLPKRRVLEECREIDDRVSLLQMETDVIADELDFKDGFKRYSALFFDPECLLLEERIVERELAGFVYEDSFDLDRDNLKIKEGLVEGVDDCRVEGRGEPIRTDDHRDSNANEEDLSLDYWNSMRLKLGLPLLPNS